MIHAESVPGVTPAAGRRPRALLVGALPGFRGRRVLRKSLEVVEAGAFDAVHALEASHPEVVVIDFDRSDERGELYGIERLKEAAVRSRRDSARITLYSLLGEVRGWSGDVPPEDDATLVVAKVL